MNFHIFFSNFVQMLIILCITIDDHKDKSKYMDRVNQQNAKIEKYVYKYFLIICPTSVLVNAIGSVLFNLWKYGHVDPNNLYRNYRFMYVFQEFSLKIYNLKK